MAHDAVVDLGETGTAARYEPPAEPVPRWQARALLAALFAFGLVVGVLGWQARVDNALDVELVAAGVVLRGETDPDDPSARHLGLSLYNSGSHDVTLVGLALPGWEPEPPVHHNQILRASEWTDVGVAAAPTCDAPVPSEVVATLRRDADEILVTLPLPPQQAALTVYDDACRGVAAPLTVAVLQDGDWLNARTDNVPVLSSTISVSGAASDDVVVALDVSAAGLTGEAFGLPVPMLTGGRVDVAWQIADCRLAQQLDEASADITVESVAGQRSETVVLDDPYLTYVLANYVEREC